MKKSNLLTLLYFSFAHFTALFVALWASLDGLANLWNSGGPSIKERAGDIGVHILGTPGFQVWDSLSLDSVDSSILGWTFYLGNSVLWGVALTVLYRLGQRPLPGAARDRGGNR